MYMPFQRNPFKVLESKFKLRRTSGDQDNVGVHAAGSYHYRKAPWGGVEAYDYGTSVNSAERLLAVMVYLRDKAAAGQKYRGKNIREVFGPHPWYVKDGVVYHSQFPGHGDHVHVAFD